MSGSFWKFGQDYSMESSVTKLLNNAFIKKENNNNIEDNNDNENNDDDFSLNNEEDFDNFNPNLEILDDLVDEEELYTELMCSNFKLLMYLKYPIVLEKLIDYIANEKFVLDSQIMDEEDANMIDSNANELRDNFLAEKEEEEEEEEKQGYDTNNGSASPSNISEEEFHNNSLNNLNQDIIILSKEEQVEKLNELEREQSNALSNNNSDSISDISEETSVTIPPETEEQIESRRARMAAEILSADIWQISSTIVENEHLLNKIWSIIKNHESNLSITISTYFMKINERLLDTNMERMIEFILAKENLVDKFLKHIDNPSLMDFLLKVISTDKPDMPTGIINQLYDQDFIPKILDLLDTEKYDNQIQSAAADFLKAFITLSANSNNEISIGIGPNELTRQLVSEEMTEILIKIMLKGGTSLSNGVGIIIELIRKNNSDYDFIQAMFTTLETHPPNDRDPIHLTYLIKLFAKYMPDFINLMKSVKEETLLTPFGSIEPLGFERFKICELVAEILHCSNMTLLNETKGEQITKQRDLVRYKELHSNLLLSDELEDLEKQLKELSFSEEEQKNQKQEEETMGNNDNDTTIDDDNEDENNDTVNNIIQDDYENSLEIYPNDIIPNSPEIEKKLRDDHVPGDELKISLYDTGILRYIVDMFFKFEWNNFLHNVVFDVIQQTFNGPLKSGYNRFLLSDLISNARLTDKIIEGDLRSLEYEESEGIRLGYMGHLTLIAEEVAKFVEYIDEMKVSFTDDGILDVLNEDKWQEFMNTTLAETREKYNAVLGDFVLNDEDMPVTGENSDDNGNYNEQEDDYDYYQDSQDDLQLQYQDAVEHEDEGTVDDDDRTATEDDINEDYKEYEDPSGHKTVIDLRAGNLNAGTDIDNSNINSQTRHNDDMSEGSRFEHRDIKIPHYRNFEDEEDEYMDPNDDGQSYAKPNHPLYNDLPLSNSQNSLKEYNEDNGIDDEDIEDAVDQDDDHDSSSGDEDDDSEVGYSLCRSSSVEATNS